MKNDESSFRCVPMWTKHSPNLGEDRIISSVPTLQRASKQQQRHFALVPQEVTRSLMRVQGQGHPQMRLVHVLWVIQDEILTHTSLV